MDTAPAYLHVASELQTNLTIRDQAGRVIAFHSRRTDLTDPLMENTTVREFLLNRDVTEAPSVCCIGHAILYAVIDVPEGICLVGPMKASPTLEIMENLPFQDIPEALMKRLDSPHIPALADHILLLHNMSHAVSLSEMDFYNRCFSGVKNENNARQRSIEVQFGRREEEKAHNSYADEKRLMDAVEAGDVELVHAMWGERNTGSLGITAKDPARNGRNLALFNVLLCSRAAIRGGLYYETAFSMFDAYSQQIEEMKNLYELYGLVCNAQDTFARRVREIRNARCEPDPKKESPVIRRCKDYIYAHLHGRLTVTEVADALHVHPNYLTALFRTTEGVPLYRFILREKVNLARNLLIYSDYSNTEIAEYLGFSSQSHLARRFKEETGLTPGEYRCKFSTSGPCFRPEKAGEAGDVMPKARW